MKKSLAAVAVLATTAPVVMASSALAHDGATGIVETRMHAMKEMGKAVRSLKGMMEDESSYDAETVRTQAKIIKLHAGEAMNEQFPEGSLEEPTHAKPEIWSDWDRFSDLSSQLETLAGSLELAAENGLMMGGQGSMMMKGDGHMAGMMGKGAPDLEMLGQMPADGVFTMLVKTCSSCHLEFRARKP
nr:cytochrome c [uncultured Cohaesibacter sp.]